MNVVKVRVAVWDLLIPAEFWNVRQQGPPRVRPKCFAVGIPSGRAHRRHCPSLASATVDGRLWPEDVTMRLSPETLADIARRAYAVPEVRAVFLFGSQARGQARPDSDIDLVVVYSGAATRSAVGVAVRLQLWGLPFGFDLLVLTEEQWSKLPASRAWYDRELLRDALRLDAVA